MLRVATQSVRDFARDPFTFLAKFRPFKLCFQLDKNCINHSCSIISWQQKRGVIESGAGGGLSFYGYSLVDENDKQKVVTL